MSPTSFLRTKTGKFVIVAVLLLLVFTILFYFDKPLGTKVTIGDDTFRVSVAITPQEITKGLGGRSALGKDEGMLFAFNNKDRYPFWMKDMNFPIDIIWIEDNVVIDITSDVQVATDSSLPTYQPRSIANKVLEINAGEAEHRNINIGDTVTISD